MKKNIHWNSNFHSNHKNILETLKTSRIIVTSFDILVTSFTITTTPWKTVIVYSTITITLLIILIPSTGIKKNNTLENLLEIHNNITITRWEWNKSLAEVLMNTVLGKASLQNSKVPQSYLTLSLRYETINNINISARYLY